MTSDEKLLVKIQGLFTFTTAIAGIFVNVYLFQFGDLKTTTVYNLVGFLVLLITYSSSGYLLRHYKPGSLMRSGLLLYAIFFGLLFLLQQQAFNYIIFLAMLYGVAGGLYWAGLNLQQYIATHEHTRGRYFGKLHFWLYTAQAIGPLLGGLIIRQVGQEFSLTIGYGVLFAIIAILMTYMGLLSTKVPVLETITFKLSAVFNHRRTAEWNIVLIQHFIVGLWQAFSVMAPVIIFTIVNEELKLGAINTAAFMLSSLASLLATRISKKHTWLYVVSSIGITLGAILFSQSDSWGGIIGFILLIHGLIPLTLIPFSKYSWDALDRIRLPWQQKYDYIIEREVAIGLGRLINFTILLLFFADGHNVTAARTWVLWLSLLPVIFGTLLYMQIKRLD